MNDMAMQYIAHWSAAERDWSFRKLESYRKEGEARLLSVSLLRKPVTKRKASARRLIQSITLLRDSTLIITLSITAALALHDRAAEKVTAIVLLVLGAQSRHLAGAN